MNELDIATSYGAIHVYKKGNGLKTIILLHGSGCDNAMLSWSEVIQNFNDEYTIYAPDLLGYGKSEKPDGLCGEHFFDVHIRCSGSSTNCFCLGDMIPHESICVLVSCVHRVSELLLSNCYQRFVINAI